MLMFENAIFASFVPQIIMFLGYVMCVVAPSLSQIGTIENQNYSCDTSVAHHIYVVDASPSAFSANYIHFYGVISQVATETHNVELAVVFADEISTIQSDNRIIFGVNLYLRRFSRPPPYSC